MVCGLFSLRVFLAMKLLSDRTSFDPDFMIYHIFPEIDNKIAKTRPEMRLKGLDLHPDNAPTYTSWQRGDELD
jgi:hypothetical protein